MPRVAFVNGQYCRHDMAHVHIEDRGLQFADGVYEVWAVKNGHLLDAQPHFDRLKRSLAELQISAPMPQSAMKLVIQETLRRNHIKNGLVYLQVTRGTAPRDHAFPSPAVHSTLIITAKPLDYTAIEHHAQQGVGVVTVPENRWGRCDIKTTSLTANVLAKQAAKAAGAYEAWFVDADGHITEGSSTNAWIIDKHGRLVTRPASDNILRGVTRAHLIEIAEKFQIHVEERAFTIQEVLAANEAFITSASAFVTPVISIDGQPIGTGEVGEITTKLRATYIDQSKSLA